MGDPRLPPRGKHAPFGGRGSRGCGGACQTFAEDFYHGSYPSPALGWGGRLTPPIMVSPWKYFLGEIIGLRNAQFQETVHFGSKRSKFRAAVPCPAKRSEMIVSPLCVAWPLTDHAVNAYTTFAILAQGLLRLSPKTFSPPTTLGQPQADRADKVLNTLSNGSNRNERSKRWTAKS